MGAVPVAHSARNAGSGSGARALAARLRDEYRIVAAVSAWPGPQDRLVRISAHRCNQLGDYERLAEALRD